MDGKMDGPLQRHLSFLLTLMDLSGLTTKESFAKLDFEIYRLEKRLLELRSLRNTLPPISSLPNEVLVKIFLICHHQDIEKALDGNLEAKLEHKPRVTTRLTLSWVSQCWRAVALSYPDFWAFVEKGSLDYIQACLDRSEDLLTTVNLLSPSSKHIEAALKPIHRICSINVSFNARSWTEDLNPNGVWDKPAPHLISLSLKHLHLRDRDQARILFSSAHPRLQRLIISDCDFGWQSSLISVSASTLTTLHMINPKWLVQAEVLAETLRTMTSLVHCKLVRCLVPPGEVPGPEHRQRVFLPNLRTLTLEQTNAFNPFALLFFLNIPNSSIDIQPQLSTIDAAPFNTILQSFEEYWTRIHYWEDISLRHIAINGSSLTISTITEQDEKTRHFTMTVRANSFGSTALSRILRLLSLAQCNPESIFLQGVSRSMVDKFARFTNLRVVRLNGIDPIQPYDHPLIRDDFFPALRDLEVDGVHYASFEDFWGS